MVSKMSPPPKRVISRAARYSIDTLFEAALRVDVTDPRAQRYTVLARRVGMRSKLRLGKRWKLLVCKGCKRFIIPGASCRVRLQPRRQGHIVITCTYCKSMKRIPLRKRRRDLADSSGRLTLE